MFGRKPMLTRIAITTLMASMLLVSAASAATIVPIGSTDMTFAGTVVVEGNLLDPADLTINGILTLIDPVIGTPVFTLEIATGAGRGVVPKWTMWQDGATVIGKGTMDDFTLIDAGTFIPAPLPSVINGLIFSATYNGDGYDGPNKFDFNGVGESSGNLVFGPEPATATWTGITVFGQTPPVPEPATMSLLALGGLAILRRRRKQ